MCTYAKDLFTILDECKTEPLYVPFSSEDKSVRDYVRDSNTVTHDKHQMFDYDHLLYNGHLVKRLRLSVNTPEIRSDGVNSFSCGKIFIRKGTRPQGYFKVSQNAADFYNLNKDVCLNYEVDADKCVVVKGCFDTNKHTLQRTAIPVDIRDDLKVLPTYKDFLNSKKAIMATIRKMKIEELSCPQFTESLYSHFKKESLPGFTQQYINGINTKAAAFKTSSIAAKDIYSTLDKISKASHSQLVNEFIINKPKTKGLYTIGARNKRDLTYDEMELGGSRAVHMPELHNEISIAGWIDAINDSIKANSRGPIYIGNSITTFERYERDLKNNKSFLEGDWRKFDSTYRVLGIIICACITRLYYPKYSKRADVHFYWIFYLHLIKDYYMPGGNVIRILNGLPSGTKCTSIWNSIFNLYSLLECCNHLNYSKLNFAVGGDDFVIMSKMNFSDIDVERVSEASSRIGMEFKFLLIKSTESSKISDFPFFYKYTVRRGLPTLSPAILLERILCPFNINIKTNVEYLEFLNALIPALGHPSSTLLIFYALYKNTYNRVYSNTLNFNKLSIGDVFKLHKNSYRTFRYAYKRRSSLDEVTTHYNSINLLPSRISFKDVKCINNILLNVDKKNIKTFYFS